MLSRLSSLCQVSSHNFPLSYLSSLSTTRFQKRWGTGGYVASDMPEIKKKWMAAQKVGEICESMKNIAAGALPGAERHLANSRPFGAVTLPFLEVDKEPEGISNIVHILIGTERGMCGSISSNTVRAADANMRKFKNANHELVCYGKRTAGVANTLFGKMLKQSYVEMSMKVPTFEFCCHIAEHLLYEMNEWDKAILYYNEYENAVRYELKQATIYKSDLAYAIAEIQFNHYEIEAEEGIIIGSLVEWKLASQLYLYLAENAASEQASRLASMDGAVKNCNEMVNEYEKIYQGLRKSKITNDLILMSAAIKAVVPNKR